ncbi:MAG: hypothetical protein ABWZ63_00870 [Thermoleophilaceae bacterium]|jgi:hypothetical protein
MTVLRLISPAARAGLLIAAGIGLIVAPLLWQIGPAPIITGIVIGALAIELGLAGTETEGRGTLPVSAQAVYDRGLALGLLLVALIFGLADEMEALLVFALAGVLALVVTSITRYSATPA